MDEKIPNSKIIETEIPMGTVHPAALEPYRVRLFVEDEIVQEAEITIGVNPVSYTHLTLPTNSRV